MRIGRKQQYPSLLPQLPRGMFLGEHPPNLPLQTGGVTLTGPLMKSLRPLGITETSKTRKMRKNTKLCPGAREA